MCHIIGRKIPIDKCRLVVYATGIIYEEAVSLSLPFGLLGLLTYQDSTGYDLTKRFEDSLNNFWHAQSSQIYRELKRMEKLGWVRSQNVIQESRPNKRLYAITDAGRNELSKWLANAKPEFDHSHHELLMRVFFGTEAPEATLALLKECRDQCKKALATGCVDNRQNIENYSAVVDGGRAKSRYWSMTLDFGIAMTEATLGWAENCISQIEKGMTE